MIKLKKIIFISFFIFFSFVLGFFSQGIYSIGKLEKASIPNEKEIYFRSNSPHGSYVAAILKPNLDTLGVTISQPYYVWIENIPNKKAQMILAADKTDEIRIKWESEYELKVCYSSANIYDFRNSFDSYEFDGLTGEKKYKKIEIFLEKNQNLDLC